MYIVNPIPHMGYQRLLGGYIPGLIDPTCGRYCLKALLRYWYEKRNGGRRIRILNLEKPKTWWKNWISYDAYDDYPHASELLVESGRKPNTVDSWEQLLMDVGPIIICGSGIGTAASFVGHYILLIGIDKENANQAFHYLDPLVGRQVKNSPWTMNDRIERCLVFAQPDISEKLNRSDKYFTVPGA